MNFNVSGNYIFNDTTITGLGTFGENNSNMVMHLNQPLVNFTGTNSVLLGTLDLNSVNGSGPMLAGGISVANSTAATLIVEDQNGDYPEIGGNLTLQPLANVIFNFDASGNSYFTVDGALNPNGAGLTVNVTNTAPLAVGHTYTLFSYGTLNGAFSPIPVMTGQGVAANGFAFITSGSG